MRRPGFSFTKSGEADVGTKRHQSAFRPDGIVWSIRVRSKQGKLEQFLIHVDRKML